MPQTKLISSKKVIAEMFSDFNIINSDFTGKAFRFIEKAICLMEIDTYYTRRVQKVLIEDFRGELPCDLKQLVTVLDNINFPSRLPIKEGFTHNKAFRDVPLHPSRKGIIEDGYIKTNYEEGEVFVMYLGIPKDKEGYPLLPDNEFVLEAIPFYIIQRLGYSGYVHPVISREEAEMKWEKLSPRARNSVNFPTIEEMQSFTEAMTNPLLGDYYNDLFID